MELKTNDVSIDDAFLGELSRDPENEDGQWVFEDISDSDFE